MFRLSLAILFSLSFLFSWSATYEEIYDVMFDEADFEYFYDDYGYFHIDPKDKSYIYPEGPAPELPLFPIDIVIKGGRKYVNSLGLSWRKCIHKNVLIPNPPALLETDALLSEQSVDAPIMSYPSGLHPQDVCEYVGCTEWDDVVILHFMVCPFTYDVLYRSLYFMKDFQIYVETEDIEISEPKESKREFAFGKPVIKSMVLNSADVDKLELKEKLIEESQERIDYLIVTKESLREAFTPLMQWKKTKGLYSKIVSIEDIEANYSGETTQLKIKKCLYDLYSNNGLKYVLLGGDDTVVPVQGCYGKCSNVEDYNIPTDLYYACFGAPFNWDKNQNGIYGEISDDLNLAQSIYVTRLPIRTEEHIANYTGKLLKYEQEPVYTHSFLMGGSQLNNNLKNSSMSDAEAKGDVMYDLHIAPYWNGKRYKFYDSYTDFDGCEEYDFHPYKIQDQLKLGYSFFDVIAHGNQQWWIVEANNIYTSYYATTLVNPAHTIITTMSCRTNAFDNSENIGSKDPCLSEAFIRGAQNGVVAYLGCSRAGWFLPWYYKQTSFGPSLTYEKEFYTNLVSPKLTNKNFGNIVSIAKTALINKCNDAAYRWVQFGLNPIGDPEMPIFIAEPLKFEDVKFSNLAGKGLDMAVGVDSCRICVMSAEDFGETFYEVFDNVSDVSLDNLPVKCNICITKQGYIPKQYTVCHIQNEEINESQTFEYDIIKVGAHVTDSKQQAPVFILSGGSTMSGKTVVFDTDVYIGKNAELLIK